MPFKLLDLLELEPADVSAMQRHQAMETHLITVPILEHFVLAGGPEIMGLASFLERNLHYAFLMCEDGLVAVAEVEAPDFDVLVGGAGDDEFGVGGDVH